MPTEVRAQEEPKTRNRTRGLDIKTEVEKITPNIALKWLEDTEHTQVRNRNISEERVALFSEMIVKGEYELTHQGIALWVGEHGKVGVIDGQHRLWGVVNAKVPVKMLVSRFSGKIEDALSVMETFDRGQKRNLGQVLLIGRNITRGATRAGAIRMLLAFLRGGGSGEQRFARIIDAQILDAVEKYKEDLDWAVTLKRGRGNVFLSTPIVGALIYSHSIPEVREKVEHFGRQLSGGEGLFAGDPAMALRDRILNTGSDNFLRRQEGRMQLMRLAFSAVSRSVQGEQVRKLEDGMAGFEFFRRKKEQRNGHG